MKVWPYEVHGMRMSDILKTVNNPGWQQHRLSLKGLPTDMKLDMLEEWLRHGLGTTRDRQIQVDNYINALKRGGQLNDKLEVVR